MSADDRTVPSAVLQTLTLYGWEVGARECGYFPLSRGALELRLPDVSHVQAFARGLELGQLPRPFPVR